MAKIGENYKLGMGIITGEQNFKLINKFASMKNTTLKSPGNLFSNFCMNLNTLYKIYHLSHVQQKVQGGMCAHRRLQSACAFVQSDQSL